MEKSALYVKFLEAYFAVNVWLDWPFKLAIAASWACLSVLFEIESMLGDR